MRAVERGDPAAHDILPVAVVGRVNAGRRGFLDEMGRKGIALREGLSMSRTRELLREVLARRAPQPPTQFLATQAARLNEALQIAFDAMVDDGSVVDASTILAVGLARRRLAATG